MWMTLYTDTVMSGALNSTRSLTRQQSAEPAAEMEVTGSLSAD